MEHTEELDKQGKQFDSSSASDNGELTSEQAEAEAANLVMDRQFYSSDEEIEHNEAFNYSPPFSRN